MHHLSFHVRITALNVSKGICIIGVQKQHQKSRIFILKHTTQAQDKATEWLQWIL